MPICEFCGVDHGPSVYPIWTSGIRVLATTFPKCGTNLLIQYLEGPQHITLGVFHLLNPESAAEGTICQLESFSVIGFGHIPATPAYLKAVNKHPTRVIMLVRDPRDAIVSHMFWAKRKPNMAFDKGFESLIGHSLNESDDMIMDLILTSPARWESFLPWRKQKNATVIRYENLIQKPASELAKIATVVRGTNAEGKVGSVGQMMGRKKTHISPTFRKGEIGDWKDHFEPYHIKAFEKHCALIMETLGYDF